MKTFIKVTEIWLPNKEETQLELASGIYGMLDDFRTASEQMRFDYGQGLPGKVWKEAQPMIITDLAHSCFERTEAAQHAGLTCAIALPVFSGKFLSAVIVFLCGDDEEHAGAIEIWTNDNTGRTNELGVKDGYYGSLEYFEFISRKTKIMKGFGLPGRVWEIGLPMLMDHLDESEFFIRGREAKNAGISTALGIPVCYKEGRCYLMTFLSAKATPIARQIEIWLPDDKRERLVFTKGFSDKAADLAATYESKSYAKGEGEIGRVWLTETPVIVDNYGVEESIATLLMPVVNQGILKAVVVFCL